MPRGRAGQQPQQQPSQKSPAAAVSAAATAGMLLPPEALAVAVPTGGALDAAAVAASAAAILGAFDAFNRKRAPVLREHLVVSLTRLYPDRSREEILKVVREEMAREAAFDRNQRERLDRDIPLALQLATPDQRRIRVEQILARERRYTQMREQAAQERAAAATEYLNTIDASPSGAYWALGAAKKHTPLCLKMAGNFWPHEVLRQIRPTLHAGCQCRLLTLDDAVARGYMHPDQVPDKADAITRAAEITNNFSTISEAAEPEEIDMYIEALREAPLDRLRYPKGTSQGGEFRSPSEVGTPSGRGLVHDALRRLIPRWPTTPAERRRDRHGEWKTIAGRQVFVPEHRLFEREINGRVYVSPPQSTRVYEQRDFVRRTGPEIPRGRGAEISDTAMKQRQEWRRQAAELARAALAEQRPGVPPAAVGGPPKPTHSGMLDAGFRTARQTIEPSESTVVWHYYHPQSGARAQVAYRDHRVSRVVWEPGRNPVIGEPLRRPPVNIQEFLDDTLAIARDIAVRNGHEASATHARIDSSLHDNAAYHGWDGEIALGPDAERGIGSLAAARAAGRPLTYSEARNIYASYRSASHEALHAAAPISQRAYEHPTMRGLEEALTEELAGLYVVETLRRQGLDEVLRWLAANPSDFKVEGHYSHYRNALAQALTRASVPPETMEEVLRALKFDVEAEQRPHVLAGLLTEAGRAPLHNNHAEALDAIDKLFARAHARQDGGNDVIVPPLVRPDLRDIEPPPPVVVHGEEVMPGSWVEVKGTTGRVEQIYRRDGGPLFDVRFGDRVVHAVDSREIERVRARGQGVEPGADEVTLAGDTIRAGDTVSYLNGSGGRTSALVERIIRVQNPDLRVPEKGWQIEAHTVASGQPVLLTAARAKGLRKERGARSPGGVRQQPTVLLADSVSPRGGHIEKPATYIRFGDLPTKDGETVASTDHLAGPSEKGVSVYHAWRDPRTEKYVLPSGSEQYLATQGAIGDRPIYEVSGIDTGERGSDGEPLLDPGTVKVVRSLTPDHVVNEQDPWLTISGKELPDDQVPNWQETRGPASPGGERFVDPNTIPVETRLGPVTFSERGDQVGPEYHSTYTAHLADGTPLGTLSVSYLGDTAAIQMIEVPQEHRRQGVASALVQRIRNEQPGVKIETLGDVTTPEGRAFVASGRRSRQRATDDAYEAGGALVRNFTVDRGDQKFHAFADATIADDLARLNDEGFITSASHSGLAADHPGRAETNFGRVGYVSFPLAPNGPRRIREIARAAEDAGLEVERNEVYFEPSLSVYSKKLASGTTSGAIRAEANRHANVAVGLSADDPYPSGSGFMPWLEIRDQEMARLKAEHGGLAFDTDEKLLAAWRKFFDDLHATASRLTEADSSNDFASIAPGVPAMHFQKPVIHCRYCGAKAKKLVVTKSGVVATCARHVETAKDDEQDQVRDLDPEARKLLADTGTHFETSGVKRPRGVAALGIGESYEEALHPRGRTGEWIVKLFHGTNVDLRPGDLIRANEHIGAPHSDSPHYEPRHVYVTTGDHLAERYAVARAGKYGGKPHVYEVKPVGEPHPDPEYAASGFGSDQLVVPMARVVREVPLPGLSHWASGALARGPAPSQSPGGGDAVEKVRVGEIKAGDTIHFDLHRGAQSPYEDARRPEQVLDSEGKPTGSHLWTPEQTARYGEQQAAYLDDRPKEPLRVTKIEPVSRQAYVARGVAQGPRQSRDYVITLENDRSIRASQQSKFPVVRAPAKQSPGGESPGRPKIDSLREVVTLPRSGKAKKVAESVFEEIDKVLVLPRMEPVSLKATAGKNKTGQFKRIGREVDGKARFEPDSISVSVRPPGPFLPEEANHLTLAHEVAHYLDSQAFNDPGGTLYQESVHAAAGSMSDEEYAKARPQFQDLYPRDQEPPLLRDWFDAVMNTAAVKELREKVPLRDYETHRYLVKPTELFARSFAQWLATKTPNGSPLNRALAAWQSFPTTFVKHVENWKGEKVPVQQDSPRSMLFRQWQDDDFAPVAAALDAAFAKAGLLR